MSIYRMFGISVILVGIALVGLYLTGDPVMNLGTPVAVL